MSMGPWCNVVSTSPALPVSGYLRCSARLAEKELILPSTQPYLSLPARLVKGAPSSGRRTTLVDHRRARRVVQGAGSTPAGPSKFSDDLGGLVRTEPVASGCSVYQQEGFDSPQSTNLTRRQFLTLILIAPLIRVYRAKDAISFSELVAVTLRKYAPKLREYLFQTNEMYHLIKERIS